VAVAGIRALQRIGGRAFGIQEERARYVATVGHEARVERGLQVGVGANHDERARLLDHVGLVEEPAVGRTVQAIARVEHEQQRAALRARLGESGLPGPPGDAGIVPVGLGQRLEQGAAAGQRQQRAEQRPARPRRRRTAQQRFWPPAMRL
jgi:hypothetical protein